MTPFELTLTVLGSRLIVDVVGASDAPVCLYTRACAWGCAGYTLHLALPGAAVLALRERARVWTRHGPVTVTLARGQRHREVFDVLRPGWEGAQAVLPLRGTVLSLHMTLSTEAEPQAAEHGVTVGTASSPECVSAPPHAWLLPG